MSVLGLRVTQKDRDAAKDIADKEGLPLSVWIKRIAREAITSNTDVGDRELPKGEVTIPIRVDNTESGIIKDAAAKADMRTTAWLYNLVLHHIGKQAPDTQAIDTFFSEATLEKAGASYRKHQHLLTIQMYNQLLAGKIGLNEASTGTGKSLAILVAATAAQQRLKAKPMVIATATRALQAQLMADIEQYAACFKAVFDQIPNVTVFYGKQNYVSPTLAKTLLDDPDITENDKQALATWMKKQAAKDDWLVSSLQNTVSDAFPMSVITCEHDQNDDNPYQKAKEKAKDADIVVTSHHMLLASKQNKHSVLFQTTYCIIDEAHLLENSAETVLSMQVSVASTQWACKKMVSALYELGRKKEAKAFIRWGGAVDDLHSAAKQAAGDNDYIELMAGGRVAEGMGGVIQSIVSLNTLPHIPKTVTLPPKARVVMFTLRRFTNVASDLQRLVKSGYGIASLSVTPDKRYVRIISSLSSSVRHTLTRILWDTLDGAVCCSATLCVKVADGYSYQDFVKAVGLQHDEKRLVFETPIIEQWLYDNAVLYVAPDDAPVPSSEQGEQRQAWLQYVADLIHHIDATPCDKNKHGGIMVLMTAYSDIEALAQMLKPENRKLLVQTASINTHTLSNAFADASGNAILLGLGAFWTGVDFKGHVLTDLIISRLPISPKNSGGIAFRFSFAEDAMGVGAAVGSVLIPRAKIMLRQGIGRLIRSKTDYGRIYITDPRIVTRTKWSFKTLLDPYQPIRKISIEVSR